MCPTRVRVTCKEGRYHQIKRMIGACGGRVVGLHREAMGPLRLGTLPVGEARYVTLEELQMIQAILPPATRDATERRGEWAGGEFADVRGKNKKSKKKRRERAAAEDEGGEGCRGGKGGKSVGGKRCGACNRAGHSKRHCPDPQNIFPAGACFRCGEKCGVLCPRPDGCPVCHGAPHAPLSTFDDTGMSGMVVDARSSGGSVGGAFAAAGAGAAGAAAVVRVQQLVVCPESRCFRCGAPGHAAQQCTSTGGGGGGGSNT